MYNTEPRALQVMVSFNHPNADIEYVTTFVAQAFACALDDEDTPHPRDLSQEAVNGVISDAVDFLKKYRATLDTLNLTPESAGREWARARCDHAEAFDFISETKTRDDLVTAAKVYGSFSGL